MVIALALRKGPELADFEDKYLVAKISLSSSSSPSSEAATVVPFGAGGMASHRNFLRSIAVGLREAAEYVVFRSSVSSSSSIGPANVSFEVVRKGLAVMETVLALDWGTMEVECPDAGVDDVELDGN